MKNPNPFRYFKTSPEIIRLAVMMYIRFPLSLRNVEDLLHERGIDICHETVRYWWKRFGPMFAHQIRNRRTHSGSNYSNWRWHLDEVFVKINGETFYLWRAVDNEGEGRYCLAQKAGGRLCLNTAKVPGEGPRGRCGWHGGTGRTEPKTAAGKKRIGDAQRLRWAKYRAAK